MISIFIFLAWDTNTKAIQKMDQAERRADEESEKFKDRDKIKHDGSS